MKERVVEFLAYLGIGQLKFEQTAGLTRGYVNKLGDNITVKTMSKILAAYPELNKTWLLTGEGEMLVNDHKAAGAVEASAAITVPLLPISAQGGLLNDFVSSVNKDECEQIISPVKGADFAITVAGDSMAPEYPSGTQIFIKKIDEKAFIDWGKVYVLDTCNGSVIKRVFPSDNGDEDRVKCVSINREYPSFEVSLKDVFGVYRVLLSMSIK